MLLLAIMLKIYPNCYIGDNAVIGDNCILFAGVKVYSETQIGNHCKNSFWLYNWFRWLWICAR